MVAEKAALPVVIRRMLIREGPISNLSCCARIAGPSFLGCIDCISRFFLLPSPARSAQMGEPRSRNGVPLFREGRPVARRIAAQPSPALPLHRERKGRPGD